MADLLTTTPRKKLALSALLKGCSVAESSQLAKVTPRTLNRWMAEPGYVTELRQAEGELISEAIRSLIVDMSANHAVLRKVRDDPRTAGYVRIRAAAELDNSLLRWRELQNVEERLARIEAALYGKFNA